MCRCCGRKGGGGKKEALLRGGTPFFCIRSRIKAKFGIRTSRKRKKVQGENKEEEGTHILASLWQHQRAI